LFVVIHGFWRFVAASEKVGRCGCLHGVGFGFASPCFLLVQLLIEAMDGRVQVADNPGGGADVQLLLPGLAGGQG
jgi:K+-sensing histidine kinase KdpD